MRESRPYGFVRGVPGDRHPYRDSLDRPIFPHFSGMAPIGPNQVWPHFGENQLEKVSCSFEDAWLDERDCFAFNAPGVTRLIGPSAWPVKGARRFATNSLRPLFNGMWEFT